MDDEVLKRIVDNLHEVKPMRRPTLAELEKAAERQRIVQRAEPLSRLGPTELDDFSLPSVKTARPKRPHPSEDPAYDKMREQKRKRFEAVVEQWDKRRGR